MKFKKNDNKGKMAAGVGGAVIGVAAAAAVMVATDKNKREKVQAGMKQVRTDAEKQIQNFKKKYGKADGKRPVEHEKTEKSESDATKIARM